MLKPDFLQRQLGIVAQSLVFRWVALEQSTWRSNIRTYLHSPAAPARQWMFPAALSPPSGPSSGSVITPSSDHGAARRDMTTIPLFLPRWPMCQRRHTFSSHAVSKKAFCQRIGNSPRCFRNVIFATSSKPLRETTTSTNGMRGYPLFSRAYSSTLPPTYLIPSPLLFPWPFPAVVWV